jgi:cytochrome c oxidase subunit 2
VLPTHTKIRFLITSGDVIHSWWVPELGVKKDAIPGYVNTVYTTIEKPGVYRGQCAELCGRGHAYMPIVVKAVPPAKFKKWLADQPGYHKKGGKEEKKVHKLEQKEHHNEAPEQTSID